MQLGEEIQDAVPRGGVQAAGGLVGQNDRRPADERPAAIATCLALATGERPGPMGALDARPTASDRVGGGCAAPFCDAGVPRYSRPLATLSSVENVGGIEKELLEDESDVLGADSRELAWIGKVHP